MKMIGFLSIFILFSSFSCATAKVSPRARTNLRAPSGDFAYRVKGSDETGKISKETQAKLFSVTKTWAWPLKNLAVSSPFGNRHGDFHDGLDLKASFGTPVYSVSEGKVIYSGNKISGYGNMVVVKHVGDFSTIYAHNEKLLVQKGDIVKRGELIAYSGSSGRSTGPHLHFEVRQGVKAINPLYVLSKRGYEFLPVMNKNRAIASSETQKPKGSARVVSTSRVPSSRKWIDSPSRHSQSSADRRRLRSSTKHTVRTAKAEVRN